MISIQVQSPFAAGVEASPSHPVTIAPETNSTVVVVATPGPPGPQGPAGAATLQRTTSTALSGHRLVVPTDAGSVEYADAADVDHQNRPIWITTGAWGSGVAATLTAGGLVTEPTWTWTPGLPIWLGLNGALTQTIPPSAAFVRRVAEVVEPTVIDFRPQPPIVLT